MKDRALFYYFTFDNAVVDLFITVKVGIRSQLNGIVLREG